MKYYSEIIFLSFFFFSQSLMAVPEKKVVDFNKGDGDVEFFATGHPNLLRIHGKGSSPLGEFSIKKDEVSGVARFELESLDTGIDMRNSHMKEKYLEVKKYPEATLKITRMTLPTEPKSKDYSFDHVPFEGELTLHGETHKVAGTSKIVRQNQLFKVESDFSIKIKDYGIAVPQYAGITVADDVRIHVSKAVSIKE